MRLLLFYLNTLIYPRGNGLGYAEMSFSLGLTNQTINNIMQEKVNGVLPHREKESWNSIIKSFQY
jgi:hypothetical protein|tara:strand:- start:2540 stop:2734 length:195 start_codon:yes stop_codon:yes gene_type:complete